MAVALTFAFLAAAFFLLQHITVINGGAILVFTFHETILRIKTAQQQQKTYIKIIIANLFMSTNGNIFPKTGKMHKIMVCNENNHTENSHSLYYFGI